jgi:hypothetical protein
MTPLQRPVEFKDKPTFAVAEAAEFERTFFERMRQRVEDREQQTDLSEIYVNPPKLDDLRTSPIVEPVNGMLPPLLPGAQAHTAPWRKRSYDNPENAHTGGALLVGQ